MCTNSAIRLLLITTESVGAVEAAEFGSDMVYGRVAQLGENSQGLLPGGTGSVKSFCDVVAVAEVGEGVGFVVAVAEVAMQLEGVLETDAGLFVMAEVMVCVAEAVPGGRLPNAVAELLLQGERLPAVGEGLLMPAEQGVVPADRVERPGLSCAVTGGPVQG